MMTTSSRLLSIVTAPGVAPTSAISAPFRQKVQRAPDGLVATEIRCVVPSKIEAQPLTAARPARSANAHEGANPRIPPHADRLRGGVSRSGGSQ
jgi:hypothetical protein